MIFLYIIFLSKEFFNGADIDIEVKAKVIYESDTKDIINQYIIFCKVLDEQREKYGMTEQAIKETIKICKDRNVLKEYLECKETEVVTIMMSLFDDERIMKTYAKDIEKETARRKAKLMLSNGRITIQEMPIFFPEFTEEEAREIEAEVGIMST